LILLFGDVIERLRRAGWSVLSLLDADEHPRVLVPIRFPFAAAMGTPSAFNGRAAAIQLRQAGFRERFPCDEAMIAHGGIYRRVIRARADFGF